MKMCDRTRRRLEDDARRALRETITVPEGAAIIGVSSWVLYDLCRRGVIPHARVGRRILLRRASLLEWLKELEAKSVNGQSVRVGN